MQSAHGVPHIVTAARGWIAVFYSDFNPVRSLVPPPLEAVLWRRDRGLVAAWLVDCDDSNWGPYKQVTVGIAARPKSWMTPPLGALWLEKRSSDYGYWVQFSAVSNQSVAEAMAEHWSIPTFHADIDVSLKRSKVKAIVQENGTELLRLEMKRPGAGMPQRFAFRTYTRADDQVLKTDMLVDAVGREKSLLSRANLTLRRHDRLEPLRSWNIHDRQSARVRWYDSLRIRADEPSVRFKIK